VNCDPAFSSFSSASKKLMSNVDALLEIPDRPILDLGCGFGRNAVALALRGASVVCVDRDLNRLRTIGRFAPEYLAGQKLPSCASGFVYPVCVEVDKTRWPFSDGQFSAIICVHFLQIDLLSVLTAALQA
jgi:tellurite methyltransferase